MAVSIGFVVTIISMIQLACAQSLSMDLSMSIEPQTSMSEMMESSSAAETASLQMSNDAMTTSTAYIPDAVSTTTIQGNDLTSVQLFHIDTSCLSVLRLIAQVK